MKLHEHIAVALSVLPTLAGCVGVIGGGYMALCTAPMWIDTVSKLAADAVCASVCGIGAGVVLAVCMVFGARHGRRKTIRNRAARCLGYVSAEEVCRASRRVR